MKLDKISKFWAKLGAFVAYTAWLTVILISPERTVEIRLFGMLAVLFFCLAVFSKDD